MSRSRKKRGDRLVERRRRRAMEVAEALLGAEACFHGVVRSRDACPKCDVAEQLERLRKNGRIVS